MIRADKGLVELKGAADDVVFELTNLTHKLLKSNPDLITSVLSVYTDELEHVLEIANPRMCKLISNMANIIKKDLDNE